MTTTNKMAPYLFWLSIYVPNFEMPLNHFFGRDEEPLLFQTVFKRSDCT